jgi:hypothetical protein
MNIRSTCACITCFSITCHKELGNFGITCVCDNNSLRITSYSDDMNILKEYDSFHKKILCNNNTIT